MMRMVRSGVGWAEEGAANASKLRQVNNAGSIRM
jgi:hypothetical protein